MAIAANRSFAIERVGIVGAGAAAAVHLRALQRLPGKQVVAIHDIDPRRAAGLAAEFGLPRSVVMDRQRLYENGKPQLVHVVTPPHVHEDIGLEALARGVHVFVEKPPALTLEGCRPLQSRANSRGVTIGINEKTALEPQILRACRAIVAGRLGQLVHIDGFYSFGLGASELPPKWMDRLPGGMLEDLLPHLLTIARRLAGGTLTPEYWHLISSGRVAGQGYDELRLFLTKDNGPIVNLTISLTGRPKAFSFAVRGTHGVLVVDLRNMLLSINIDSGGPIARNGRLIRASLGVLCQTVANTAGLLAGYRERYGSSLHSIRAHYAALEMGQEIPAPLSRGIETVEIIRAIWPA
jgi:predicted dehydrogenase